MQVFAVFVFLFFFANLPLAQAKTAEEKGVSNEVQARIIELFSKNQCSEVGTLIAHQELKTLRPNVKAIVAYCEPAGVNAEDLFALAEKENPTGDLIMVLHAKSVWKKNPDAARPLWEKVLEYARNVYFKDMAQEHLDGVVTEDRPISLSPLTLYGSLMMGVSSESNPIEVELPFLKPTSSAALNLSGKLNAQYWFPLGSASFNYAFNYNHYFDQSAFDTSLHYGDLPIALHAGQNEDIVFRPFMEAKTFSGQLFEVKGGVGVSGVIYRPNYKQSVQGLVYADGFYFPVVGAEDANHYRFEYSWDFFPQLWTINTQFFVEHAAATDSDAFNGVSGQFNNSHTDVGINVSLQRTFNYFTLGLVGHVVSRNDSAASTYTSPTLGTVISKTREDLELSTQPNITIHLVRSVNLFLWYEVRRIRSNLGPDDYVDRNMTDRTFGLALKTYLSSY